jgi:thiamine pyrophosphate-dependent acetolactate synthase large subunit-like protein
MADRTGRHAIIEQFLADDIHYMFGNPGTVEQGFLDAVRDFPNLKYINTLQETIAVAIADGYARAIKRPAVVQLHSGVGLGIRFDELAKGMGVPAVRVEKPDQVGPAIRKALEDDGPFLIGLVIANHVPGAKIGCKCGQ